MSKEQKQKQKGKVGGHSPSDSGQRTRTAANKARSLQRAINRTNAMRRLLKTPRGAARAARRMASGKTR